MKPAAIRHRIAGIDPQVEQREFEFGGIDRHRPKVFRDFDSDLDILSQRPREHLADLMSSLAQVDGLWPQRLTSGEGEQLPGQPYAPLGGADDRRGATRDDVIRRVIMQQCGIPAHHSEEVVEIMRNSAGELSDGLHSLGLAQCGFGLLSFLHLKLQPLVDGLKIAGSFIHYCLDPARIAGTEEQQRTQKAGADDPRDENDPALPSAMLLKVGCARYGFDTVMTPAEAERSFVGGCIAG